MSAKSRTAKNAALPVVSDEIVLWCAGLVIGYSLLIPMLALESMFLAESAIQFAALHQAMMLAIVFLGTLNLFGSVIVGGWKNDYLISLIALSLLLASLQPATQCCTTLVAVIAGMLPRSELSLWDVSIHMMPIIGCVLIMSERSIANGQLTRWSLFVQSAKGIRPFPRNATETKDS